MLRQSHCWVPRFGLFLRICIALAGCVLLLYGPTIGHAADDDTGLLFFYLHDNPPKVARAQHQNTCPPTNGKATDSDQGDNDAGGKGNDDDEKGDEDKDDDEKKIHYGPDACKPRKTLMQWSYGTTFSGGPPGMDEPLESDRPDFTESPVTVGKGVVQLETGYEFFLNHRAGDVHTEHTFPDTLWRIGMFAEWFEWRIEYSYDIINDTISNNPFPPSHLHASGSEDLSVGAKFCLTPQEGILPAMGIIPSLAVPSGSPSITEGGVMPGLIWAYAWEINKKLDVEMSTDVFRRRDDDRNIFTEFAQSIAVQYHWTKHFETYMEWYVTSPTGRTIERTEQNADGGFVFPITNNLQLDVEAGVGLNEAAQDFFAGAGATVRF